MRQAFATQLAQVYRQSYGLFVCNGILYNHESPRRGENFVTRKIARAAARIARKLETELVLGNIESQRDWGRAQDYVQAMWLMLQHSTADDYVVATGESHSVRDFVEAAFAVVNLPWQKYVKHDPAFDRPAEPARLPGCADKIRKKLGWKPVEGACPRNGRGGARRDRCARELESLEEATRCRCIFALVDAATPRRRTSCQP